MKPYLVDVPVKINIWIRPECQRRQFEVIKQARPSILFLQSDGGRNEEEWKAIYENRKMIDEGIDWNCTVYRIYADKNHGLYTMGRMAAKLIWETVDRCVFLEDDHLPAVSYFSYCAELLERYKDDQRIEVICGMNHLEKSEDVTADYFFSRSGSIWGTATWKRVVDERGIFDYINDPYVMRLLKQRTKHDKAIWKKLCGYGKNTEYGGHVAGGEFYYSFHMYSQNRLQIIPKYNLISNMGATANGAHSDEFELLPKGIRQVFNMPVYEMQFPMKHAQYVIPDVEYEKRRDRIMAYNMPIIGWIRRVERSLLLIKKGKYENLVKRIVKTMNRKKIHET